MRGASRLRYYLGSTAFVMIAIGAHGVIPVADISAGAQVTRLSSHITPVYLPNADRSHGCNPWDQANDPQRTTYLDPTTHNSAYNNTCPRKAFGYDNRFFNDRAYGSIATSQFSYRYKTCEVVDGDTAEYNKVLTFTIKGLLHSVYGTQLEMETIVEVQDTPDPSLECRPHAFPPMLGGTIAVHTPDAPSPRTYRFGTSEDHDGWSVISRGSNCGENCYTLEYVWQDDTPWCESLDCTGNISYTIDIEEITGVEIDSDGDGDDENSGSSDLVNWTSWFNRASAVQTVDALAERIREAPRGPRAVLRGVSLGTRGRELVASMVSRREIYGWPERESRLGGFTSAEDLLRDSSFYLPFQGNESGPAGREANFVLWGQGSILKVKDKQENTTFDGDTTALWMGVDGEWGDIRAGVALGRTTGEANFDRGASCRKAGQSTPMMKKCRGVMDAHLNSLQAYMRTDVEPDMSVWAALGYGVGEAKKTFPDMDDFSMKADLDQVMAAVGTYGALVPAEKAYGFEIGLQADALFARMTADYEDNAHDENAVATRLRVGLVAERNHQSDWGGVLASSLEGGVRYDGGDGATGIGVEMAGRIRHFNPIQGLTVSASVGGLVMHTDDDFKELGASGSFRWDPGRNGRGGAVSLQPAWGTMPVGSTLSRSPTVSSFSDRGSRDPRMRLDGEFSYGFNAFQGKGTHAPFVGFSLEENSGDTVRAGWRTKLAEQMDLAFEGSRRFPWGRDPRDDRVALHATLGW